MLELKKKRLVAAKELRIVTVLSRVQRIIHFRLALSEPFNPHYAFTSNLVNCEQNTTGFSSGHLYPCACSVVEYEHVFHMNSSNVSIMKITGHVS